MRRIDELEQAPRRDRRAQRRSGSRRAAGSNFGASACFSAVGVLPHLVRLVAIDARDLLQHMREGRAAVARVLGEIRAAPERLGVGGEEHGERPAALLAELVQRAHVDGVDVGALLAVDLDVDEEVVHHAPRWRRPRSSRAPSRGTNGRRRSRPRAGSACRCAWPRPAPPAPTPTNAPGCPGAGGDRGWSRGRAGFLALRVPLQGRLSSCLQSPLE